MENQADRKLKYIEEGRSGYLVYSDHQGQLKFYFEFGGGDCVVLIFVPSEDNWEAETKRASESRMSILTFIAERAIRDKAPDCFYKLSENCIEIYEQK